MNFLGKFLGILAVTVGAAVVLFTLLALFDPAGAQHANDANPFGASPTVRQLLGQLFVGGLALAVGWRFICHSRRSKGD